EVLRPCQLGAPGGALGLALPAERLTAQEQIPHALVFVLVSPSASAAPVRAGIPAACRAATACSSRPDRPAGGAGRRGGGRAPRDAPRARRICQESTPEAAGRTSARCFP